MRARDKPAFKKGGILLGVTPMGNGRMRLHYVDGIKHTLVIGSTGSGKSRRILMPSIGLQGLAGESMITSDPKGELYQYTAPFLRRLGYEVIALDFVEPLKSQRYNFLQPVINAVAVGDLPKAMESARDLTQSLVGKATSEPIWTDGQSAIIAASIMAVVYDNQDHPEYQNMTNVYHFILEMTTPGPKNAIKLNPYIDSLPEHHPARAMMGAARVSPDKMRGSFFGGAITTLQLFASPYIAHMTSYTDFDPTLTGSNKYAIFIILPDEKTDYYKIASLFVGQQYEMLVAAARKRGGMLKRRVNFNLDELGNFSEIPSFAAKLTAARSRHIRFNLFLQDLEQLDDKYGNKAASTIRSNCDTWIYLRTKSQDTLRALSQQMGNYTTTGGSISTSYTPGRSDGNYSSSQNLIGRPLLEASEIEKIDLPYSLVLSHTDPAIFYSPDLSELPFNALFGLGDEDYNAALYTMRNAQRPEHKAELTPLWGIWNCPKEMQQRMMQRNQERRRAAMESNNQKMEDHDDEQNQRLDQGYEYTDEYVDAQSGIIYAKDKDGNTRVMGRVLNNDGAQP